MLGIRRGTCGTFHTKDAQILSAIIVATVTWWPGTIAQGSLT